MLNFFSTFAAATVFERERLTLTSRSFDPPSDHSLRSSFQAIQSDLIRTFSGQDPQTKSQIAFATIIKKIHTSDNKNNWIYLIKNLILLDRLVEQRLFIEEISGLVLSTIDEMKESDGVNQVYDSQRLVKTYWRLIKEKSQVLTTENHVFCFKRSQRMQFLAKLSTQQILNEIHSIDHFFNLTFKFVKILSGRLLIEENPSCQTRIIKSREQFSSSKLSEYMYLQILHKLMLYYSCQLQCNNCFLQLMSSKQARLKQQEVREFRKYIIKFKQFSNQYIRYVQAHKTIKGFQQMNYRELNPFQNDDIIKIVDEFITQKYIQNQNHEVIQNIFGADRMRVEKTPLSNLNTDIIIPRIRLKNKSFRQIYRADTNKSIADQKLQVEKQKEKERKKIENNRSPFSNWVDAYSDQFPQKEVMTVDLIVQLKQDQQNQKLDQKWVSNDEQPVEDTTRQSNSCSIRDTQCSKELSNILENKFSLKYHFSSFLFENQFSELPTKWNSF